MRRSTEVLSELVQGWGGSRHDHTSCPFPLSFKSLARLRSAGMPFSESNLVGDQWFNRHWMMMEVADIPILVELDPWNSGLLRD